MKKTLIRVLSFSLGLAMLLSLAISLAACGTKEPENHDYVPSSGAKLEYLTAREYSSTRTAGKVSNSFRDAAADFALKLFAACVKESSGSTLVSPLSVMTALAMTANGARGETLKQMEKLLGGKLTAEEINEGLFNLYTSLGSDEGARLDAANSVWVTSDPVFSVDRNFIRTVENTYRADVISVDFGDKSTVDAVNGWAAEKTENMIKEIIAENDVDEDTMMALLNAILFDAEWEEKIGDEMMREGAFHAYSGDETVTMMFTQERKYISGKDVTGFIKNYKGGKYAFVALLPNEGVTVGDYIASLSGDDFLRLVRGAKGDIVHAGMPKFSFDYSAEMNETLIGLGMKNAFDSELSDLSGLGVLNDGSKLYISKVIHKTHIDVDNAGTRAAAVTAVIVYRETSVVPMGNEHTVTLDRPFVYAIIDTSTSLPVFIGSCESVG